MSVVSRSLRAARVHQMRLAAVTAAALALSVLSPTAADADHADHTVESAPAASMSAAAKPDPKGTTYLYKGSFVANMSHTVITPWGGNDSERRDTTAQIRGTFPKLRMNHNEMVANFDVGGSTTTVVSAKTKSVVKINDGQLTQTCTGTQATTSGKPMVRYQAAELTNYLIPFTLLGIHADCTYSDGQPPTDVNYYYGPLDDYLINTDSAGAQTLRYQIGVTAGTKPHRNPELCPGYIPGQTTRCSYVIEGMLTLELIKKIPPKAPPKKASITKGATQVSTGVSCPTACTVSIGVTPLSGGPQIVVPRIIKPRPGRTVQVKIAIPANKRALVKRAGGVKLKLVFRVGSRVHHSETRAARL